MGHLLWACSLLTFSFLAASRAQDTRNVSTPERPPDLLTEPFFAEITHGKIASDITASDLRIVDNDKPAQSIVAVHGPNELPLRVGLIIDTSNSQRTSTSYKPAAQSALAFLEEVAAVPNTKVFVATVDANPDVSQFMGHDELTKFTPNLRPGGATALFDAVYASCKDRMSMDQPWPARRVLVILTDGDDNYSRVNIEAALAAALQTRTALFFVYTGEGSLAAAYESLKRLADGTGGLTYVNPSSMKKVFLEIRRQIANMYVVTYAPADMTNKQVHSFKLTPASDKKLKLRSPVGFYVAPKSP